MIGDAELPATNEMNPRTADRARDLKSAIALVTGASSGIGQSIAIALAAERAGVCLVGRNGARLEEAEAKVLRAGARACLAVRADLTNEDDLARLTKLVNDRFGGVDVLVHSAGEYERAPLETAAIQDFDTLYRANLRGPYRLTQLTLESLRQRKGDIIFVNSTQGLAATASVGQYAATQHGVKAVADSLREEINCAGVRVTVLHAGSTATPRQQRIRAATGRQYEPERLLQPEDIASMVIAVLRLPRSAEVTSLVIRPMQKT